jgi:GT2 family glycosyltransferase
VGIRRSKGEFVLLKVVDSFYSDALVDFLSKKRLEKNCFYRVARYDVKIDITKHEINSINLESNIESSYEWSGKGLFTAAAGDFILMARSSWFRIRGFPEDGAMTLLGTDNEVVWAAKGMGLNQVVLQDNIKVYKIWHPGLFSTRVKVINYDNSRIKIFIKKMPSTLRNLIKNIAITIRMLTLGALNLPHTTVSGIKTRSYFRYELMCYLRIITFGGAFFYSNQWGLKSVELKEYTLK